MNIGKKKFLIAATCVSMLSAIISLTACGTPAITKTGSYVANKMENKSETEYVFCVSKNSENAQKLLDGINAVIDSTDCQDLINRYLNNTNKRNDFLGELDSTDNTGETIKIYTTGLSPYQYSGAYGNGVDGVDPYLMVKLADNLNMKPVFYDLPYDAAYNTVKKGDGDILAAGVALTEQLKNDFLVSKPYSHGFQQIVSDKAENFKNISNLKGMRIGVLTGRQSYAVIKDEITNGSLKNSNTTIVEYSTDTEAFSAYRAQECDVLVVDEYSAKMLLK